MTGIKRCGSCTKEAKGGKINRHWPGCLICKSCLSKPICHLCYRRMEKDQSKRDDLVLCPHCYAVPKVTSPNDLKVVLTCALNFLSDQLGMKFTSVPTVFLVSRKVMEKGSGTDKRLLGRTNLILSMGRPIHAESVYILKNLPHILSEATLVHELVHVWVASQKSLKAKIHLKALNEEEALCDAASYMFLMVRSGVLKKGEYLYQITLMRMRVLLGITKLTTNDLRRTEQDPTAVVHWTVQMSKSGPAFHNVVAKKALA